MWAELWGNTIKPTATSKGSLDALVRMFEQALKYVFALLKERHAPFIDRLETVRQKGQSVGWGFGDDFDTLC